MSFPFNVYLPAFAGAFIVSLAALPCWRVICRRIGLVDDPGHRKIHETPMPLAGGLAVLTGMVLPLLLGVAMVQWNIPRLPGAHGLLEHGLDVRRTELIAIVLGAVGIVVTGWLDDQYELKPLVKFTGQLLVAALIAVSGIRITLFVHSTLFSYAVTILWMLTVINAFNFMDNMNGLCAGLGAIGSWFFALIAIMDGQYLVALLALLACGALLGFLPYNFPKASAFLGDTGSHLVGYLLAVMAILPHFYTAQHPRRWSVLIPLLILAVPLGDLAYVVMLRWKLGKPFYHGDTNHLSHRLVKRGLTKQKTVLLIWLAAAMLGGAAAALMLRPG
ncbi:MAG TPA: MraY family glycosyltransferase [Verrucomicrobiae bacterium]|nr:MraY family glycosyltransferase [Verrucomicrobiae bacterium]